MFPNQFYLMLNVLKLIIILKIDFKMIIKSCYIRTTSNTHAQYEILIINTLLQI